MRIAKPITSLGLSKGGLFLLLVGIAVRLPALISPISEGYRNAQTAALTANMTERGALRFDPIAPWRGDLEARLALELPLYNLAALAVHVIPGVPLDVAGRSASLIFWILSFIALQALWRRTLPPNAAFWANLLFIFSPMNWYLSTAFMPESLLQLLAIWFMICTLDYASKEKWAALAGLFLAALLGLLVKFPGFVHLGLFAALVLIDRQGFMAIFKPVLILAGLVMALSVYGWGEYVKAVNWPYFAEWSGWENVVGFVQPERSRLSVEYWLPLAGYNTAFISTAFCVPFIAIGIWHFVSRSRKRFASRIWIYLLIALACYWLLWGKAAPVQNYYNLPNLVFLCAAFGAGMSLFRQSLISRNIPATVWRWTCVSMALLVVFSGYVGFRYLMRPDTATIAAAAWVCENTDASDLILYQPRHEPKVMDYQHQPLLSYLSGRRTWVWTRLTPNWEKERALATSAFLVVTTPPENPSWLELLRQRFKGPAGDYPLPVPETTGASEWGPIHRDPLFVVYSTR